MQYDSFSSLAATGTAATGETIDGGDCEASMVSNLIGEFKKRGP